MKSLGTFTPKEIETAELLDRPDLRRFSMQIGEHRARLEYDRQGDRIFLTHTEVPKALEGKGVDVALVEKVFHWIEEHRMKLVPTCPCVKAHLRRKSEWKRLLVKGIHI